MENKIVKPDVSIAKNYLKQVELEDMGKLVNSVLDLAECMANFSALIMINSILLYRLTMIRIESQKGTR